MDDSDSELIVKCCIKNCQKEIARKEAIEIEGKYFCKICGVHYYRNLIES